MRHAEDADLVLRIDHRRGADRPLIELIQGSDPLPDHIHQYPERQLETYAVDLPPDVFKVVEFRPNGDWTVFVYRTAHDRMLAWGTYR